MPEMTPLNIPTRPNVDDPVYDLARHYLRSSAWSEAEVDDLAEKIHETIEAWFDANIIEDVK
jgi:TPP-dependent pyruvate/acetoin dehydrogenase alpha subunit